MGKIRKRNERKNPYSWRGHIVTAPRPKWLGDEGKVSVGTQNIEMQALILGNDGGITNICRTQVSPCIPVMIPV